MRKMSPEESAAYVRGLREGFALAKSNVWLSTHDGWRHTEPTLDWDEAHEKLAKSINWALGYNDAV
jgi:hypothetical protein